jgi:hypothetical protein
MDLALHENASDDDPRMSQRVIGSGERRTVWLINGVVYKVGRQSSNRYEHEALTAWRQAGAVWAPATTLWTVPTEFDENELVVAMEYLPDDGGDIDPAVMAEIRRVAPQTCSENYVSHGGRLYLIDGEDVDLFPVHRRGSEGAREGTEWRR